MCTSFVLKNQRRPFIKSQVRILSSIYGDCYILSSLSLQVAGFEPLSNTMSAQYILLRLYSQTFSRGCIRILYRSCPTLKFSVRRSLGFFCYFLEMCLVNLFRPFFILVEIAQKSLVSSLLASRNISIVLSQWLFTRSPNNSWPFDNPKVFKE